MRVLDNDASQHDDPSKKDVDVRINSAPTFGQSETKRSTLILRGSANNMQQLRRVGSQVRLVNVRGLAAIERLGVRASHCQSCLLVLLVWKLLDSCQSAHPVNEPGARLLGGDAQGGDDLRSKVPKVLDNRNVLLKGHPNVTLEPVSVFVSGGKHERLRRSNFASQVDKVLNGFVKGSVKKMKRDLRKSG